MYSKVAIHNNYGLEEYVSRVDPLVIYVSNMETKDRLVSLLRDVKINVLRGGCENIFRGRIGEDVILYLDQGLANEKQLKKFFDDYIKRFLGIKSAHNNLTVIINFDNNVVNNSIDEYMLHYINEDCHI